MREFPKQIYRNVEEIGFSVFRENSRRNALIMVVYHDHRRRAELQGALHHLARVHRGVIDAAGVPDRQTLSLTPARTALPFALVPLLPSPKDESKQERGRNDNQRQNGTHRCAAVRRSMIGQGW